MRISCSGVRARIYSGTGILVVLGLVLAGIAVAELASISRQVTAMAARSENSARTLEVERLLEVTGRSALGYWLSGDPMILKQSSAADTSAETLLKQAIAVTQVDAERGAFQSMIKGIADFRGTRNVLMIMTDEVAELRHDLTTGGDAIVRQDAELTDAIAATGNTALTATAWDAARSIMQAHSDVWRFFATPDAERQGAVKASVGRALNALDQLPTEELSDELQSHATTLISGLAVYLTNFEQLSDEILKQRELFDRQMRPQIEELLATVGTVAEAQRHDLELMKQATQALITKTILIQKTLAGTGFVLGVLIALLVCRGIIRPLAAMTAAMVRLATGDIAVGIPSHTANDEISAMAKAVEVFRRNAIARAELEAAQQELERRAAGEKRLALTKMAETIERQTSEALEQVGHHTEAMAGLADAMAASASRTGAVAQNAAAAAAQSLTNAQTVASAAEQLAASVREIGRQASQSIAVVGHAIDAGRATRETIVALNERVGHIGVVAEMIGEIAAKTNLLALNATIEAARAGAAGKGFAVVASEVKQLATQAARSTQEIGRQIGEVRAATDASVTAVDQIEHTIAEIEAIAGSIAAAVEQQGAATAEIARNVGKSAAAARNMTKQVTEVSGEAEQTSRNAVALHADTTGLNTAISALKHSLNRVVRTSTAEVDRRRHPRYAVDLACQVSAAGYGPHDAQVADLSESGACVRAGPPLPVGANGTLQIHGFKVVLPFVVRSMRHDTLNLEFEENYTAATALRLFLNAAASKQAA